MKLLIGRLKKLLSDEEGVTAIEYSIIASSIALVIVLAVTGIGQSLVDVFEDLADGF